MAEAPLPDDPATVVPGLVQGVARAARARVGSEAGGSGRAARRHRWNSKAAGFCTTGSARPGATGAGRATSARSPKNRKSGRSTPGYDEVVVKTKNRYYDMRGTLDRLQFDVVKFEPAADNLESKVYLSKRLGPFVLDAHRELTAGDTRMRTASVLLAGLVASWRRRRAGTGSAAAQRGVSRAADDLGRPRRGSARPSISATTRATTTSRGSCPTAAACCSRRIATASRRTSTGTTSRPRAVTQVTHTARERVLAARDARRQDVLRRATATDAAAVALRSRRLESAAGARERQADRLSRLDRRDASGAVRARRPAASRPRCSSRTRRRTRPRSSTRTSAGRCSCGPGTGTVSYVSQGAAGRRGWSTRSIRRRAPITPLVKTPDRSAKTARGRRTARCSMGQRLEAVQRGRAGTAAVRSNIADLSTAGVSRRSRASPSVRDGHWLAIVDLAHVARTDDQLDDRTVPAARRRPDARHSDRQPLDRRDARHDLARAGHRVVRPAARGADGARARFRAALDDHRYGPVEGLPALIARARRRSSRARTTSTSGPTAASSSRPAATWRS